MKEMWDDRYSTKKFAYGEEPNNYLKHSLKFLQHAIEGLQVQLVE